MYHHIIDRLRPLSETESAHREMANIHMLSSKFPKEFDLVADREEYIIDIHKLLEKGHLIEIHQHPRFLYFPMHSHNFIDLVCVLSGEFTMRDEHLKKLTLREGDLLLLNQYAKHEIFPCGEDDIIINIVMLPEFFLHPVVMLEQPDILRDFIFSLLSSAKQPDNYLLFHTKEILPIENLLENIIWSLIEKRSGMNAINQTTMGLLLMNLSEFASELQVRSGDQKQDLVLEILKYIDRHYKEGTLKKISQLNGYTPNYLSHLLKEQTGNTFKQLLRLRRLQQAAYLLENTSISIVQIMNNIGYENSSFFYRIFQEMFQCSPQEYRKIHTFPPKSG